MQQKNSQVHQYMKSEEKTGILLIKDLGYQFSGFAHFMTYGKEDDQNILRLITCD